MTNDEIRKLFDRAGDAIDKLAMISSDSSGMDSLSRSLSAKMLGVIAHRLPKDNLPTKRELFAAMAMQGILASDQSHIRTADTIQESNAIWSVRYADALLAELGKHRKAC